MDGGGALAGPSRLKGPSNEPDGSWIPESLSKEGQRKKGRKRHREREKMFLRRLMLGAGGPLLAKVKETTGIVGLDVVPNAREVLISLYTRTLDEIKAVPEDEGYRKAVECFTKHRLNICQQETDWEHIEKKIGCGQVEELIEEAEDELKLIAKMIEPQFPVAKAKAFSG
ncbi:hypothetical protein ACLOJK_041391 [Asimina triloba]